MFLWRIVELAGEGKDGNTYHLPGEQGIHVIEQQARRAAIKEVAQEYHLEMAKVFEKALTQTVMLDERQKLKEAITRHKNYAKAILEEEWLKEGNHVTKNRG